MSARSHVQQVLIMAPHFPVYLRRQRPGLSLSPFFFDTLGTWRFDSLCIISSQRSNWNFWIFIYGTQFRTFDYFVQKNDLLVYVVQKTIDPIHFSSIQFNLVHSILRMNIFPRHVIQFSSIRRRGESYLNSSKVFLNWFAFEWPNTDINSQ